MRCSDFLRPNRHSNRVSASCGLRFRETGFRGQRKTRRNDLPTVTVPSLRKNRRTHPRQFGAFSYAFRKSPVAYDCVVGPGGVPSNYNFNNLNCLTVLRAWFERKTQFSQLSNPASF
jgi:hypothetical protein